MGAERDEMKRRLLAFTYGQDTKFSRISIDYNCDSQTATVFSVSSTKEAAEGALEWFHKSVNAHIDQFSVISEDRYGHWRFEGKIRKP